MIVQRPDSVSRNSIERIECRIRSEVEGHSIGSLINLWR